MKRNIGSWILVGLLLTLIGLALYPLSLRIAQAQGPAGTLVGIPYGPVLPPAGANPPQGSLSPLFVLTGGATGQYFWNPVTGQWQNGTNQFAQLTADFTTGSGTTALQAITGLALNLDGSGQTAPYNCILMFSQATPVADAIGIGDSVAPTRLDADAWVNTSATATTFGNLANLTTTTPTAITTATPTVSTVLGIELGGIVVQTAGTPGVIQFYMSQATAANVIVVKAGSFCRLY
jgi:hypothetical protein